MFCAAIQAAIPHMMLNAFLFLFFCFVGGEKKPRNLSQRKHQKKREKVVKYRALKFENEMREVRGHIHITHNTERTSSLLNQQQLFFSKKRSAASQMEEPSQNETAKRRRRRSASSSEEEDYLSEEEDAAAAETPLTEEERRVAIKETYEYIKQHVESIRVYARRIRKNRGDKDRTLARLQRLDEALSKLFPTLGVGNPEHPFCEGCQRVGGPAGTDGTHGLWGCLYSANSSNGESDWSEDEEVASDEESISGPESLPA